MHVNTKGPSENQHDEQLSTVATKQKKKIERRNTCQLKSLTPATVWVAEVLLLGQDRETMQTSDEQEDHGDQLDKRVFKAGCKVGGAVWVKGSLQFSLDAVIANVDLEACEKTRLSFIAHRMQSLPMALWTGTARWTLVE